MPPDLVSEGAQLASWLLRRLVDRLLVGGSGPGATVDAGWQEVPEVPALPPPPWAAKRDAAAEGYQPMPEVPPELRTRPPADPPAPPSSPTATPAAVAAAVAPAIGPVPQSRPAGTVAGTGPAVTVLASPAPRPMIQTPAPAPAQPSALDSYSAEMDDDPAVACVSCTRRHLWEMKTAAADGLAAVRAGDTDTARRKVLRVAAEAAVLDRYDWTDEKFSKARPRDLQAIGAVVRPVQGLTQGLPTAPKTLVLAWGSLDEALRFARSPHPSPRDHAEIADRLDGAGAAISDCESEGPRDLPPAQRDLVLDMLPVLRQVRHQFVEHLNGRKTLTQAQLNEAEQVLHTAALALQPAPTADQAQALATAAAAAEKTFKQALFSAPQTAAPIATATQQLPPARGVA